MKLILILLVIVMAGCAWFVVLPQAKCAGIARDMNAAYSFSAVRGCMLQYGKTTWLLTPNYLRTYQQEK